MAQNFALFVRFYYRPGKASSDALDNASFGFAIVVAALVMFLWRFGAGQQATAFPFIYAGAFFGLFALFLVMVPVSISVLALWDSLGSPGVVVRREYLSLVVSGLIAWAVAHLPLGLFLSLGVGP